MLFRHSFPEAELTFIVAERLARLEQLTQDDFKTVFKEFDSPLPLMQEGSLLYLGARRYTEKRIRINFVV